MTVSTTVNQITYTATASQTVFPYTFKIFDSSDLQVYVNDILKTLTVDYTISGIGNSSGGDVTFGTGLSADDKIFIIRKIPYTQGFDYVENDAFPASSHEEALDKLVMMAQQNESAINTRSIRFSETSGDLPLPELSGDATARANMTLIFDADGNPALDDTNVNVSTITDNIDKINTVAADLNGSRDSFDYGSIASSDPVSNPASPTGALQGVYDIRTDITTVSGISADVTTVATNDTNVTSVADNMATIITASTAANNAAADADSAEVARAAAVVAKNAAETAKTNAATSATNAETAYDNFDDRYLGQKSSDPSVDNDGNALLTGAIYFNTASSAMKVYTGSAWTAVAPVATSVTASQISDVTATATELNYVDGVTSAIQTQLDSKSSSTSLNSLSDCTISASDPATDTNPSATGHLWVNTTSGEVFVCTDITSGSNVWTNVGDGADAIAPPPWYGGRGLFGGGDGSNDFIDYITIATTSNATDFGNLTVGRAGASACSNGSRGVFSGGYGGGYLDVIDYVTIASTGNATDFGDITSAAYKGASTSGEGRGVLGGARTTLNVIDYITISTTGNAIDFGDLTAGRSSLTACSDGSRGVFGGGNPSQNVIDYVTIASTGNAIDFGDLTVGRYNLAACSSTTRGVFAGGWSITDTVDYITIATTSNATDFGNLTGGTYGSGGTSDAIKGVFGGGKRFTGGVYVEVNVIDYITIASTGNAADFGDLSVSEHYIAGCSGD